MRTVAKKAADERERHGERTGFLMVKNNNKKTGKKKLTARLLDGINVTSKNET